MTTNPQEAEEARAKALHVEAESGCEPFGAELQLFWAEVSSPKATARSLAVCYALLIAGHASDGPSFWHPINQAINSALGLGTMRKVDAFRKVAWAIHDAAAKTKDHAHDQ